MKVELVKKSDNPLFQRIEVEFRVDHSGAPTPKRLEVRAQLASLLGSSEELLVIDKMASSHGRQMAAGTARLYGTREQLDEMEPAYLLKRGLPKEAAEGKPAEKPEAKPEKKPAEAKPEKPAGEKPKEVKKEKAGEDKGGKEG